MSHAFNYPFFIEEIQNNFTVRATSFLDPGNSYYNSSIGVPTYNLAYAREILIEGGKVDSSAYEWSNQEWKDKSNSEDPVATFTWLIYTYETDSPILDSLREDMKLIGIKIDSIFAGEAEWNEIALDEDRRKSELEITSISWGCPLSDPSNGWLGATFQTKGAFNCASLNDISTNQWIKEAASELDPVKRQEYVNNICNRVQNELYPYIFISHTVSYSVIAAGWEGYTVPYSAPLFYYVHETEPVNSDGSEDYLSIGGFSLFALNFTTILIIFLLMHKLPYKRNLKK